MANATTCAYPHSDNALPHWKCVLRCCANCPKLIFLTKKKRKNMKKQHPQLGFTFITSLDVVLLMGEFHWKTRKYVTCVTKNLHQINLQKYTPEKNQVMMETIVSVLRTILYIRAIQQLAFYLPHVRILGTNHCGEMQRTALK